MVDPQVVEAYRHRLGVDRPVPVQYLRWVSAALRGDLGTSFATTRPVVAMIGERLPATLELMATAFALAAALALFLGVLSALHPYGRWDVLATGGSFLGIAMPVFWLGLIVQMAFAVQLGWLPVSGTHTVGASSIRDHLAHLVLPALVLSLRYVAGWSRYLRGSLLGVVGADYVRTARAKGLPESRVIGVHALRNALIPVVSIMALNLADLFSGAVITETIFAWPGVGRLLITSIGYRDYPLVQGCILLIAITYVTVNLLTDLAYGLLDPRIRYE
jgi:peptide/nickel transport system permease protein